MKIDISVLEVINGCLLGDGCIFSDKKKYFRFKLTAKDENLIKWIGNKLRKIGNVYFSKDKRNDTHILYFSHPYLKNLREKWYIKLNGKTQKVIPRDLELTPTTLFFWYIGDGSFIRHKDPNRVPWIILATNNFLKKDIEFLVKKLKELNLNFYPVRYKSGFKNGEECGYALVSKTSDATVYNFFKLIGFKPPKEIRNCITGRKGRNSNLHFIKDKWLSKEDLIKIISNIPQLGILLGVKELRKKRKLTQKELARIIGVSRESIRDFENGKRNFSIKNLRKVLNFLNPIQQFEF